MVWAMEGLGLGIRLALAIASHICIYLPTSNLTHTFLEDSIILALMDTDTTHTPDFSSS